MNANRRIKHSASAFLILAAFCLLTICDSYGSGLTEASEVEIYLMAIGSTPCAGEAYVIYDEARIGNIGDFWSEKIGLIPERYHSIAMELVSDTDLVRDLNILSTSGYRLCDQDSMIASRKERGQKGRIEHIWLSPIGADPEGRSAVVFRGFACGDKRSFGAVLLESVEGRWRIDEEILFLDE